MHLLQKSDESCKEEGTVDIGRKNESVLGTRKENLENKNMHSIFFRNTEFRDEKTWSWLKIRDLKKTTDHGCTRTSHQDKVN